MFGEKGRKLLQAIELIPKMGEREVRVFLKNNKVIHPDCGRVVGAVVLVKRPGKARTYAYARLKHIVDNGVEYCYEPVDEAVVADGETLTIAKSSEAQQ